MYKKKKLLMVIISFLTVFLAGCHLKHEWVEATCTEPKTCSVGGETEGEPLGHDWQEATCTEPRTCKRCGEMEGTALEHEWTDADYWNPQTCNICGKTEGEKLTAFFEEHNIPYVSVSVGEDVMREYHSIAVDEPLPITGTVEIKDYKKFISDETHSEKEGYEWRTFTVEHTFSDYNSQNFGVSGSSTYTDYYSGIGIIKENRSARINQDFFDVDDFNFKGEEYTVRLDSIIDSQDWENNIKKIFTHYTWHGPVSYDGFVYFVYSAEHRDKPNLLEVMDDSFIFFKFE